MCSVEKSWWRRVSWRQDSQDHPNLEVRLVLSEDLLKLPHPHSQADTTSVFEQIELCDWKVRQVYRETGTGQSVPTNGTTNNQQWNAADACSQITIANEDISAHSLQQYREWARNWMKMRNFGHSSAYNWETDWVCVHLHLHWDPFQVKPILSTWSWCANYGHGAEEDKWRWNGEKVRKDKQTPPMHTFSSQVPF